MLSTWKYASASSVRRAETTEVKAATESTEKMVQNVVSTRPALVTGAISKGQLGCRVLHETCRPAAPHRTGMTHPRSRTLPWRQTRSLRRAARMSEHSARRVHRSAAACTHTQPPPGSGTAGCWRAAPPRTAPSQSRQCQAARESPYSRPEWTESRAAGWRACRAPPTSAQIRSLEGTGRCTPGSTHSGCGQSSLPARSPPPDTPAAALTPCPGRLQCIAPGRAGKRCSAWEARSAQAAALCTHTAGVQLDGGGGHIALAVAQAHVPGAWRRVSCRAALIAAPRTRRAAVLHS